MITVPALVYIGKTELGKDGILIHEAGTYNYTVDLNTGEASLKVLPD